MKQEIKDLIKAKQQEIMQLEEEIHPCRSILKIIEEEEK